MFITLEGIEGSGKTTQSKLLAAYLKTLGHKVLLTREPGGPLISEQIRKILLDENNSSMLRETELLLYLASRSQHTGEWIIPALKEDYIVVCDRYTDSTLAYQGGGRQFDQDILFQLTRFASFDLIPDITLLIDIPVEVAMQRIAEKKPDRLEKEDHIFHQRVRDKFLYVAKNEIQRYKIINGVNTITAIQTEIRKIVFSQIKDGS